MQSIFPQKEKVTAALEKGCVGETKVYRSFTKN